MARFACSHLLKCLIFIIICGCQNEADFSGQESLAQPEPQAPLPAQQEALPAPLPAGLNEIGWYFACLGETMEVPEKVEGHLVFAGGGSHATSAAISQEIQLQLGGRLCNPEETKRNVVFIIDASGSMVENDPIINGECGRLRALKQMFRQASGNTGFALVAFSESVVFASPQFVYTEQELYDQFESPEFPELTVCQALESTYYDRGLEAAEALFEGIPEGESKEVFFLSDGAPTFEHEGIQISQSLKLSGVTIAAIMLKGADMILKDYIASVDANGDPLFASAAEASVLEEIYSMLQERSRVGVVAAELGFRPLYSDAEFTTVNPFEHLDGRNFKVPPMPLSSDVFHDGIEVYYRYRLKTGESETIWGQLEYEP